VKLILIRKKVQVRDTLAGLPRIADQRSRTSIAHSYLSSSRKDLWNARGRRKYGSTPSAEPEPAAGLG